MENPKNELNFSLIDSLDKSEVSRLSEEFLELGLDSLLEEGIIKEIPIVKFFVATYKSIITYSDKILIKKIILFLKRLNDLPKDEIDEFVTNLNKDLKFKIKLGNKLLLVLEKSDDFEKSYLLAEVFKAYITNKIDYNTFQLLCHSINNTFIEYLRTLKDIYDKINRKEKIDSEMLENLFQSGLLSVESHVILNSNGLIYKPNNIGSILIKILFNNGV